MDCSADLRHSHPGFADLYAATRWRILIGDFECDASNILGLLIVWVGYLLGQSFVRGIMTIQRNDSVATVRRAREQGMAGATVLRGVMVSVNTASYTWQDSAFVGGRSDGRRYSG